MTKTARLYVRVEPELIEGIDEIVEKMPGDRSDHVREALRRYIASYAQLSHTNVPLSPIDENGDCHG